MQSSSASWNTGIDGSPAVDLDAVTFLGDGLRRPECVVGTGSGEIYTSDWAGGVTIIGPEGQQRSVLAADAPWLRPNGIALARDGHVLLAHLGDDRGGVFSLDRSGSVEPFVTEVDGVALPPTNFVVEDDQGRVWITVSTRRIPRAEGYRPDVADGFVVLVQDGSARIVADGLGYTNEAQVHPSGRYLYVNETFAKRLSRFVIGPDGSLGPRETVTEFGPGTFPDGLVFDQDGGVWITSIISNRVIRIDQDCKTRLIIEDCDPDHLADVEAAYLAGGLDRPHLDRAVSAKLNNISSLAFCGPDRRTVVLGCLLGQSLATFRSPVAGARPHHWGFRW